MTIKSWIRDKLGITKQIELAVECSGNFYGKLEGIINEMKIRIYDLEIKQREHETREKNYIEVVDRLLNETIHSCLENIAILSQRTLSLEQLRPLLGEETKLDTFFLSKKLKWSNEFLFLKKQ